MKAKVKFDEFIVIFRVVTLLLVVSSCKVLKTNKVQSNNTHKHTNASIATNNGLANVKVNDLIGLARNYTGVPYKSGGIAMDGMDCSGLIFKTCQNAGLIIPRISYEQAEIGEEVEINQIQKGDLIFFKTAKNSDRISHVGLVTDVSLPEAIIFIHASTSKGVREDNLFNNYWKKAFAKATRPFVF
jgi:probable lipoprotein NlpC